MAGLFADLCPEGIVCVEDRGGGPEPDPAAVLLRGEEQRVARAVPSRVQDYVRGRRAAHEALGRLGLVGPVLSGSFGEPLWPDGVVGSITHCPGLYAAAVGHRAQWAGVGIDAETCRRLGGEVASAIVMPGDEAPPGNVGLVAVLSVKEAVSKATTSAAGRIVDFRHVIVTAWGKDHCLALAPGGMRLACRWAVREGLMLSVVAVPHHAVMPGSTMSGTVA